MNKRKQIEEILFHDYGRIDKITVDKLCVLLDVVFSEAELKAKLEEQLEETRQWLIDEDFEGLAERL